MQIYIFLLNSKLTIKFKFKKYKMQVIKSYERRLMEKNE